MSEAVVQRQLVNYLFYKLDPAWRRLPEKEKEEGRAQFLNVCEEFGQKLLLRPYSLVGLRPDADLMLWRVSFDLETLQAMSASLAKTGLGKYLTTTYSYLATTKRSMYINKHEHPGQEGSRTHIVPGKAKYLFVYPFVKSRDWYLLPMAERQKSMDVHIAIGHKYPKVKINTSYSFGIDDQEFVVAFEGDDPMEFVDLVMELRDTQASKYTVRDTPAFTCVSRPLPETLKDLG